VKGDDHVSILRLITLFGLCLLAALVPARAAKADWTYDYADDFAGNKAVQDSYRHSAFWSKGTVALSEPYIYYAEINGNRGLVFVDYKDQLAELGYRFPLSAGQAPRIVKGVLVVDVSFPSTQEISQQVPGRLQYQLSPDGMGWSSAQSLSAGRREIQITTTSNGTCHVLFSGTRAVIDNLTVSLSSSPVTIRVPQDFGTIQSAIDAAGNGDVIEVAPGTYSGEGFRDVHFEGKAITVRSAAGPEGTTIDCRSAAGATGGGHRGFCFYEGEEAGSVLSGFAIVSGRAPGYEVPSDPLRWTGGPICAVGGGIYCEFTGPTIDNCIVRDCSAQVGGGIGGVGASPLIVDCVIEECYTGDSSRPGGRGGAIGLLSCSNTTITNCIIRNNAGNYTSYGAGLYFSQSTATVAGCTISGNTAPGILQGGGAYCTGAGTDVTFRNCVFSCNLADMGAGLYLDGSRGRVNVDNCTLARNELRAAAPPATYAAAIQSSDVDLLVTSSILWGNRGKALVISGDVYGYPVTYSDVEGGYTGTGNLNADPLFADAGSEDYHLCSQFGRYSPVYGEWVRDSRQSPCIDAGDPQASQAEEPVPNGNRINMGAYGGTKQASMGAEHSILYVDNTGSYAGAFTTIQDAIDAASPGDTVLVWPGTYNEELVFKGKAITVQSAAHPAVLTASDYAVSFYEAESYNSVLANFVITGCGISGIYCDRASSPTLKNLTIADNGCGILAYDGSEPNIVNCVVWYNGSGSSVCGLQGSKTAYYSNIQDLAPDARLGNIQRDPQFVDHLRGDYHLRSTGGRWLPRSPLTPDDGVWVTDVNTSPCVDAGDPRESPGNELMPNGNRINMGAYGGTQYASKAGK
jgi:parallel beta-helix repeat protein